MNSTRFAELIVNPALCTDDEMKELAGLATRYPYSSAIHILNARVAALKDQDNKNNLLSLAAISTPDRSRLKQYMTSDEVFSDYKFIRAGEPGTVGADSGTEVMEPEETPSPGTEINQELIAAETTPVEEQKVDNAESQTEPPAIDEPSEEVQIPEENIAETETPSEVKPEIIREEPSEDKKDEEPVPQEEITLEPEKTDTEVATSKPAVDKIEEEKPPLKTRGTSLADEVLKNLASYRDTKAKFHKLIEENTDPGTVQAPPPATPVTEIHEVEEKFREIIKPIQKKRSSKKLPKEEQDQLISKFIETDSETGKPAKSTEHKQQNSEDLSLSSTELNDDMVTETLANILITQGKLEKAIDIYRKLIWKLPQKKAYFAARIESLKERISKT